MKASARISMVVAAVMAALAVCCVPVFAGGQSEASGISGDAAATAPGDPDTPGDALQDIQVPETYSQLKTLYLEALDRIVELEAALQEALDLARGYRSDWAEERAVAEARKAQTEQVLETAKTLQDLIREMKDVINKQHEIIMRLTQSRHATIGFTAGVSLQRTWLGSDTLSYAPGFTVGIIVFP